MRVILSCDDNPFYYDFWPLVKKVWKQHLDIEPYLVHITTDDKQDTDDILNLKPIKDVPIYLQAQLARIYYTQIFEDEICLISDIDMFPISKNFFSKKNISANVQENSFYHLNPEIREFGQFPLCYYCAHGKTYKSLFNNMSWEQFIHFILNKDFNVNKTNYKLPNRLQGNDLWFSDEIFLHTQVVEKGIQVKKSNTLILPHQRVDREQILNLNYLNLFNDKIVDIHLPRPYSQYTEHIDKIIYALGVS